MEEYLPYVKYSCIFIMLFIVIYIVIRNFLYTENKHIDLTKRLSNYFDSEKEPFKYNKNNKDKEDTDNYGTFNINSNYNSKNGITVKSETQQSLEGLIDEANVDKTNRLIRFAGDYCRASPNINLKEKYSVLSCGWRSNKSCFVTEYDYYSKNSGEKNIISSILTVIPISKSNLNLDLDIVREGVVNLITTLEEHSNIASFLHSDFIYPQKIFIKIQHYIDTGSIKDLIHSAKNPLDSYNKKYSKKRNGIALHLISTFSKQILSALNHFHNNRVYFMNLHSGNILVNTNTNIIRLVDFESFFFNYTLKHEHYYYYLIELFVQENYQELNDKQSEMLKDIFNSKHNIFEAIDTVAFGRLLYEMYTGKELTAPYPDPIEYPEMEESIRDVLMKIFPIKIRNYGGQNKHKYVGFPDINIKGLLKFDLFSDDNESSSSNKEKNYNSNKSDNDSEVNKNNNFAFNIGSEFKFEIDRLSFIKEEIFNQSIFVSQKISRINSLKN